MGADTLCCRVGWDLVLEEPQESFNPRGFGQARRVRGGGGGRPFRAVLSSIWDVVVVGVHLSCHLCPYVGLGMDPILRA